MKRFDILIGASTPDHPAVAMEDDGTKLPWYRNNQVDPPFRLTTCFKVRRAHHIMLCVRQLNALN